MTEVFRIVIYGYNSCKPHVSKFDSLKNDDIKLKLQYFIFKCEYDQQGDTSQNDNQNTIKTRFDFPINNQLRGAPAVLIELN